MAGARPRHFLVSGRVALETLLCSLILSFFLRLQAPRIRRAEALFSGNQKRTLPFRDPLSFPQCFRRSKNTGLRHQYLPSCLNPRILGNTIPERRVHSLPCVKAREQCRPRWVSQNLLPKLALESGFIHFSFFFLNPSAHISHIACSLPSAPTGANSLLCSASGVEEFFFLV